MRGLIFGGVATLVAGAIAAVVVGSEMAAQPPSTQQQVDNQVQEQLGAPGKSLIGAGLGFSAATTSASTIGLEPTPPEGATFTSTKDLPAEDGQEAGTSTTTVTRKVTMSGPRAVINIDIQTTERRGSGSIFNMRGRANIDLNVCPDPDGKVIAAVDANSSGDTAVANAAGTGGFSMNMDAKGKIVGTVNDQAMLTSLRSDLGGSSSFRGGENPTKGSEQRIAISQSYTIGAGWGLTSTPDAKGAVTSTISGTEDYSVSTSGGSNDAVTRSFANKMAITITGMVNGVFNQAQTKWRTGYCVEIALSAPTKGDGETNQTRPKEVKPFTASVKHKFEGADLAQPIEATLSGQSAVDPKKIDRAPGKFSYTAGEKKDDAGTVSLKSTSKRGIALNTVRFANKSRGYLFVPNLGQVGTVVVCDLDKPFTGTSQTVAGIVMKVTLIPTGPGAGTLSYDGRMSSAYGSARVSGGGPYTFTWNDDQTIGAGSGTATMTYTAPTGEQMTQRDLPLEVLFRAVTGNECDGQ